jgi:CDP-ribitol ribitolphosphotransferase
MKRLFYLMFASFYSLYKIFPVIEGKTTFIMTHERNLDGNIGELYKYSISHDSPLKEIRWITKKDIRPEEKTGKKYGRLTTLLRLLVLKTYHLARSEYVFLDNVFLPMAYMTFRTNVKVVQMWHGCAAIKKFGQDANRGKLAELERRANQKYTHVIVNASSVVGFHASAFGVEASRIYPLGLPRTDPLFNQEYLKEAVEKLHLNYPQISGKRKILYAPTFRDDDLGSSKLHYDLKQLSEHLDSNDILLLRLHPFVSARWKQRDTACNMKNVIDLSGYPELNAVLAAADVLVTDYSSIIYEFAVFERPIIFYAYDRIHYESNVRGFYVDYEQYVPGPIAYNLEELIMYLRDTGADERFNKIKGFFKKYYDWFDGCSSKRIIDLIYSEGKQTTGSQPGSHP